GARCSGAGVRARRAPADPRQACGAERDERPGMATRLSAISPARRAAFTVLRRVFEQGAYADRALAGEANALDQRDRALATQLAYGAVQRRATLDHIIEQLAGRPTSKLSPPVLAA